MPLENGGLEQCSDKPRNSWDYQRHGMDSLLESSEGTNPDATLIVGFSPPELRDYMLLLF